MKKLVCIVVALASIMSLSNVCFAEAKKAKVPKDGKVVREIARQIIQNKEVSDECIKASKGDAKKLITVTSVNLGAGNSFVEGYQAKSTIRACCGGEASCPTWIYKKEGDNLSKIFGPEASKELIFLNDDNATRGIRALIVVYVGGNHAIRHDDFYVFDGTKYEGTAMSKRK